jgi:Fic family protein
MAYVYEKRRGNNSYYYLRETVRKDGKSIPKDIAYLGTTPAEAKKRLSQIKPETIRKSYKRIMRHLESNHYLELVRRQKLKQDNYLGDRLADVEACRLHYKKEVLTLDPLTLKEAFMNFIVEFAYNTTSLEGNTITLNETYDLFFERRTPKDRDPRELYDIENTRDVFFLLLEKKEDLSHDFIEFVHKGLMDRIDTRIGYRTRDVRVVRASFKPTPAPFVRTDMDALLKWYDSAKKTLHPLALAGIFHHKFEKIHPFMDGNGRTGRILLNYILMQRGYPPLVITRASRRKYLDMLDKANKAKRSSQEKEHYSPLIRFIADELVKKYWQIFL